MFIPVCTGTDPNAPQVEPNELILDPTHTLFLCHFDGDTPNSGRDADWGRGGTEVLSDGGSISSTAKFGAGSIDTSDFPFIPETASYPEDSTVPTAGVISYWTANNFNLEEGTIEMWIKPNDWFAATWEFVFGMVWPGPGHPWDNCDNQWAKHPDGAQIGARMFAWMDGGIPGAVSDRWFCTFWHNSAIGDGQWHHIAWTWCFANDTCEIYVDGQPETMGANMPLGFDGDNLAPTFFVGYGGGIHHGGYYGFNGLIDEFRISDVDRYRGQSFTPLNEPWADPVGVCGQLPHLYPAGDHSENCVVDYVDFTLLSGQWQGTFGLSDLMTLTQNWLEDNRP